MVIRPIQVPPINIGIDALSGRGLGFFPGLCANGHVEITGSSGMGKSTVAKFIASYLFCSKVPVVIFDFHDDLAISGIRTLHLGDGASGECSIRFLEPTPLALEVFGLRGCLESAVRAIEATGRRKLGDGQINVLRSAIMELWRRLGITESASDSPAATAKSIRPSDLRDLLLEKKDEAESSRERQIFDGLINRVDVLAACAIFEHESPLRVDDLLQNGARLHMQGIPASMRGWVARTLVNMIYAEIAAMGPVKESPFDAGSPFRVYLVLDEAGSVIRQKADDCIIKTIAKESRKFGVGLLLAAQTLDELSEEVVANVDTHFALPTRSAKDARKVEQKLGLCKGALNCGTGRWSGFYQTGHNVYKANFYHLQ
ncbi:MULTISPECIES: DUF87 domain-containing protein [unclassified Alcanivorax]|jgi:DNA helicase HerA-like ATPase|nr:MULTISPECIES: DUF87 domain-containing protein [unclassified Alcanivorax]KZY37771.1 hypothetical protein A3730_11125 [Alcanivorax sp. HI0044]